MLGAGPGHALAPELGLRPVLTELGASVPVRGLYVLDTAYDDYFMKTLARLIVFSASLSPLAAQWPGRPRVLL